MNSVFSEKYGIWFSITCIIPHVFCICAFHPPFPTNFNGRVSLLFDNAQADKTLKLREGRQKCHTSPINPISVEVAEFISEKVSFAMINFRTSSAVAVLKRAAAKRVGVLQQVAARKREWGVAVRGEPRKIWASREESRGCMKWQPRKREGGCSERGAAKNQRDAASGRSDKLGSVCVQLPR